MYGLENFLINSYIDRVFYNPSPTNLVLVLIDRILEDCFLEASF